MIAERINYMKNIKNYNADKYSAGSSEYKQAADGVFKKINGDETLFVTSLIFEQEPELGEGENAEEISQYPLEDILDKFYCYITDFYDDLNVKKSNTCYLEFASDDMDDIVKLRQIIGKHVYNKEVDNTVELIIE